MKRCIYCGFEESQNFMCVETEYGESWQQVYFCNDCVHQYCQICDEMFDLVEEGLLYCEVKKRIICPQCVVVVDGRKWCAKCEYNFKPSYSQRDLDRKMSMVKIKYGDELKRIKEKNREIIKKYDQLCRDFFLVQKEFMASEEKKDEEKKDEEKKDEEKKDEEKEHSPT